MRDFGEYLRAYWAYVFANLYGVAKRVAASTVLVATGLSIATIWLWLQILP